MKTLQLFFIILVVTYFSSFAQKPRTGQTIKYDSAIELASFNNGQKITGEELTNSEKPIVIIFWLSTCKPCIKELNEFKKIKDLAKLHKKATILVVSNDNASSYAAAKQVAKNNNWNYNLYFDKKNKLRNNLLNRWYGVPQVMIIDTNGTIALHKLGYRKGREKIIAKKIRDL